MRQSNYDAVVVGSGPNGLAAAITLQHAGLSVLLLEAKATVGGGMRSAELTRPGFVHDICSAIHPMAADSPFFRSLPLEQYGLNFIYPSLAAAHPFDDGTVATLGPSLTETARALGSDEQAYLDLMEPLVADWPLIAADVLGPLRWPKHPFRLARFGLRALPSALTLANRFHTKQARSLLAGMAAHSMLPLDKLTTSAIALVLMITGVRRGWPMAEGGSQAIANALAAYFQQLGGTLETDTPVRSLAQLPPARTILFDLTPKQLLAIAGDKFSAFYRWQLRRYRYGMGVFKIDWALDGPIPFTAPDCRRAGTIHLGNTFHEIANAELTTALGHHPDRPFVLLAQQSRFDTSRAPAGQHTAWAYCHVPNGSTLDRTDAIEQQVERFAPGFRARILDRHTMNTHQVEAYNPNYIGGDINGGVLDLGQLFTRPAIRPSPYRTSARGVYLCSSSTPPGGAVHGLCGYHAARQALADVFGLEPTIPLARD